MTKSTWHLYILQCADSSLYTGITTDIKRRLAEHNCEDKSKSKGAKYTKSRRPVKLVYSKKFKNRSLASKREAAIKKLTREDKLKLIKGTA